MKAGAIAESDWYECLPFANGVTLIHEPWIKPFYRCNAWYVRGEERDLLIDTCLGHFSLNRNVSILKGRPIVLVASHAHFDHIGSQHEFAERVGHDAEAHVFADPRPEWTLADSYATDDMFIVRPEGWDATNYKVKAAPLSETVVDGDVIDLGDRRFKVIHTPGHSPGGIALWEEATATLFAGDIIYDGPLVDDTYHSNRRAYIESLRRLATLPVAIVHGGHFPSFGAVRLSQLIDAYITRAAPTRFP
jgi:glyoxylase-like metal-dependent hydrolase (beta-lactamase superfamily II)